MNLQERFEKNFIPEPNSGCWLWLGALSKRGGYGAITRNATKAHRASYSLYRGEIPAGMLVCHSCDVPCCVNPDHLFLGTIADNNGDRARKGRNKKVGNQGEKHPFSKLTEADIMEIRASKERCMDLATKYGVARSCITKIRKRLSWRHIGG